MHTGPGPEPRPALDQFIAHLAALRKRRNATWTGLEQRTGVARQALSAAARGHQPGGREWLIPSDTVAIALDQGLRADGTLFGLWVQVRREDEEIRLARIAAKAFPGMGGLPPLLGRTVEAREVRPTDRRLFGVEGLSAAAVLAFADGVDDQLRTHHPKITDVAGAETALADLERDRDAADPADLFPPAYDAWVTVETILSKRVHPKYIPKLTSLAGTLAAGLSTVASFADNDSIGRVFAGIAEVHANAAGEPALLARVAGIQSWQALEANLPLNAADIAAQARLRADPADRARLAAYEAEAAAVAGLYGRAENAITTMREGRSASIAGRPAIPWGTANEDLFVALTAAQTPGRATVAVIHGTRAVEAFERPCQGMALAHLATAAGHLRGDRPTPDNAAAAAIAALDVVRHAPNAEVHGRARRLASELSAWESEPLVRELNARVATV
ncbi:hypothetical protein BBK14_23480 [Parafrankia soli]|uniref:HTH cro/C1-type domain-containing protein n=1 Tax=Parafrankia soli TaxID=2599596 RepID=A0A1S1PRS4_9ACTN|nr:hypothetical protein [Parafrankia soli]OHV23949.1 hypothetical protein BBK14_23480 [Parafrankia soli]